LFLISTLIVGSPRHAMALPWPAGATCLSLMFEAAYARKRKPPPALLPIVTMNPNA